jgi:hypothetical protein
MLQDLFVLLTVYFPVVRIVVLSITRPLTTLNAFLGREVMATMVPIESVERRRI